MTILAIMACFWGFLFVLSLALVTANRRMTVDYEPATDGFQLNPLLFSELQEFESKRDTAAINLGASAQRPAVQKESVFVVDDDPNILNLIQHVLEVEGFEVHSFTDPALALEEFNTTAHRPTMVVTDYCMQAMNGLELISRCRKTAPELKTIMISGMVEAKDLAKCYQKTDRFLQKPFKIANLVQTMNETLAEARN